MDKKSKILITAFFLLLFISMAATYWRTMVKKDFEVIDSSIEAE